MAAKSNASRTTYLVPTVIVGVAAVLIALVLLLQGGSEPETEAPGQAGQATEEPSEVDLTFVERRDESDPLAAGPVDAPVGLVVFSDYQCPFCAQWHHETLPVMMELADEGKLRIEWRDLNVFGETSERASRASYAAGLQGRFWEYHAELFPEGEKRSEGELSDEALVALAVDLGLDPQRFADDMASPEAVAEVTRNAELGLSLGAASTPVFLLGGNPISGAQPTEVFTQTFDAVYAERSG